MSQKREIKGATAEERYFSLVAHLEEMEREMAHLAKDIMDSRALYLYDISVDRQNTEDSGLTEEDGEAYWEMMFTQGCNAAAYRAQDYGFDINDHFTRPIF